MNIFFVHERANGNSNRQYTKCIIIARNMKHYIDVEVCQFFFHQQENFQNVVILMTYYYSKVDVHNYNVSINLQRTSLPLSQLLCDVYTRYPS